MKIVREAIFHAPVKGNNLRTCCTPEIPNSENSLARYLAFLCVLRKLMISCEILSWLEIVYLTFTSSSKFLRLTNFHQSIELKKLPSSSLSIVQLCKSGFVRVPVFPWQFITRPMLQVGAAQKSNWKLNQYYSMDELNSCSIIIFDWYKLCLSKKILI